MPTDPFSQMLFNNGEGAVHTDFNNMARFSDARLMDQVLARYVGALGFSSLVSALDPDLTSTAGENPTLSLVSYTLTGGDCLIKQGTTGTRVALTSGTIFQRLANTSGTDASFVSYFIAESDVDLVVGAGDGSNPRVDILQMKLEYVDGNAESRDIEDATTRIVTSTSTNKRRRIQATFSIKAGTAAATPVYPAPDSGYCLVAAIRVPTAWATGFNTNEGASARLRQCTIPLKVRQVVSTGGDMFVSHTVSTDWTRSSTTGFWNAGASATRLAIPCPGGYGDRIVGVGLLGTFQTSGTVTLRQTSCSATGGMVSGDPSSDLSSVLVGIGAARYTFANLMNIGNLSADSAPYAPAGIPGILGDPLWARGGRAGPATRLHVTNTPPTTTFVGDRTCLFIDAGNLSSIFEVIWYLAG